MKNFFAIIFTAALLSVPAHSQNLSSYKRIVKTLSSSRFQGRGYAKDGVLKAGEYIEREFRKAGSDAIVSQPFRIGINTFPGSMKMSVDERRLNPGTDFVMREYSPGIHGEYGLYYVDTLNYDSDRLFSDLSKPENSNVMVVCDFWFTYRHKEDFSKLQTNGGSYNTGVIYVWDTPLKFYKAYADKVVDKPIVWVSSDFPKNAEKVSFDIDNKFYDTYESSNIIARVNGRSHDSCYVFTAHYDHLGNLGSKLYFPGANDNASGTAAIITLADYYAHNTPEYDVWFIAFSGEDSGLNGSNWFTAHPLFPLEDIIFLFNLDMIGDNNPVQYCEVSGQGKAGLEKMVTISDSLGLFDELKQGELAANSDHWPFANKGVPCIMFENESGDCFKYYHTAEDNWKHAQFETYPKIFKLVTEFISNNSDR